jgi:hypothetical protein
MQLNRRIRLLLTLLEQERKEYMFSRRGGAADTREEHSRG